MHQPDCKRCNTDTRDGDELRERLEELNWQTQPCQVNHDGRKFQVVNYKRRKGRGKPPVSVRAKRRKNGKKTA